MMVMPMQGIEERIERLVRAGVRGFDPIGLFEIESHIVAHISRRREDEGIRTGMLPFVPELVGQEPVRVTNLLTR